MAKKYSLEDRYEALKLAEEIGASAAAQRLGINVDTLYGWRNREKNRQAKIKEEVGGRSKEELMAEIKGLRREFQQARQDVEILQEAMGFFVRRRRKQ